MKNFSFDEAMSFAYGSTLLTGGSSIAVNGDNEYYIPKQGYVVGGIVPENSCEISDISAFKSLYNHLFFQADLEVGQTGSAIIGTWVEDGKIVFDLCNVLDGKHEALELAEMRGERAIYDLEEKREIFVNNQ